MARIYRYIGPADIREAALSQPRGTPIRSIGDLANWLGAAQGDGLTATFVVSLAGDLLLAPRQSEHVAAAGGEPVRSAGEMTFEPDGTVTAVTNQSTGYGPEPDSWPEVASALDRIGALRPSAFTEAFEFRRCTSCGSVNLVKDGWLVCAVCDHDLPKIWNLARVDEMDAGDIGGH